MPAPPKLVTLEEAAQRLACRPRTIRNFIARGELTGYKVGTKMVRVDARELDALVQPMVAAS